MVQKLKETFETAFTMPSGLFFLFCQACLSSLSVPEGKNKSYLYTVSSEKSVKREGG